MLEFLGDMGGLIQIVFLIVYLPVSFIVQRNFKAAIISDAYKVQKYHADTTEYYESATDAKQNKTHMLTSESETSNNSISQSSISESESNKEQIKGDTSPTQYSVASFSRMKTFGDKKFKKQIVMPLNVSNNVLTEEGNDF